MTVEVAGLLSSVALVDQLKNVSTHCRSVLFPASTATHEQPEELSEALGALQLSLGVKGRVVATAKNAVAPERK